MAGMIKVKRAQGTSTFLKILFVIMVVTVLIIFFWDKISKADEFVSTCKSTPFADYKCANAIEGNTNSGNCPSDKGWYADKRFDCEKMNGVMVDCCYMEK